MACCSSLKSRDTDKLYDICHIGGAYPGRRDFVIPVMRRFNSTTLVGHSWPKLSFHQIAHVDFDQHIELYRQSKIVLNIHRNNIYSAFGRLNTRGHPVTHLAPRVWNCAAVGSFQIIDDQRDSSLIPSLVKAVTPKDLISKCEYYLAHPDKREELAELQHKEAIKHTWAGRLGYILAIANKCGLIK
jgi:spore maturation protein CgeB